MRVLVVGANGFIGSAVVTELHKADHNTRCVVRNAAKLDRRFPGVDAISLDLTSQDALDEDHWCRLLEDVDAVVNVAGVLQPLKPRVAWNVHCHAPEALYRACEKQNVRRVIHVSATGVTETDNTYSRSKLAGEEALKKKDLDWTILRPVLVIGDGSYGGTSMIRALAVTPILTPVIGDGSIPLGIIHKNELASGMVNLLETNSGVKTTLEPSCSEEMSMSDVVRSYRSWFGLPKRPILKIPLWLAGVLGKLGDLFQLDPINSTAVAQFRGKMTGNAAQFEEVTGVKVSNLPEILVARPSESQDLWHARLFLLRPVIRMSLALFWLMSGVSGLFFAFLIHQLDLAQFVTSELVPISIVLLSSVKLAIGLVVLLGWNLRLMAWVQLIVVLGSAVFQGLVEPSSWMDPSAALFKDICLLVLILVHRVVEQAR